MTKEEFGQRIKQKYPQYNDLGDADLADRILKKYPQYSDMISVSAPPQPTQPSTGQKIMQGIGNVAGSIGGFIQNIVGGAAPSFQEAGRDIAGIGESQPQQQLGVSTAQLGQKLLQQLQDKKTTPERAKQLVQMYHNINPDIISSNPELNRTIQQKLGSAATTLLTSGTLAGMGTGGGLGVQTIKSIGIGAGFGATGALQRGGGVKEVGTGVLIGGTIGAAIPTVAMGIDKALEYLPKRLMSNVIRQSPKEIMAGKGIADYALATKRIGTGEGIINGAQKSIESLSDTIGQNLAGSTETVAKSDILQKVVDTINQQGGAIDDTEVEAILTKLAPQAKGLLKQNELSLVDANRLRQALDKTLGDRGFLNAELPFNKTVLRSFDNTLREAIKSVAPEGTREAFSELSKEITLRDAMLETTTRQSRNNIWTFRDTIWALGGYGVGGLGGGITGLALEKGLTSTPVITGAAVALNELRPILQSLSPVTRTAIMNAIGKITSGSTNSGK